MFAARPTALVISSVVFLALCTAQTPMRTAYVRPHTSIAMVARLDARVAMDALPRRLTAPNVTDHAPWKVRRKAVLEQSDPTAGEECDLGPASPPDDRSTLSLLEFTFPRLPSNRPLRCSSARRSLKIA